MFSVKHSLENLDYKPKSKQIFVLEEKNNLTFITEFMQEGDQISIGRLLKFNEFVDSVNFSYENQQGSASSLNKKGYMEVLDERILVKTHNQLVWTYTPSNDQNLYYKYGKHGYAGNFNWPTLIFKLVDKRLSVAVLRSAKNRPNSKTKIYHAPLPNIGMAGEICLGSVYLPTNNNIDEIAKSYLESTKTHFNRTPYFSRKRSESTQEKYLEWVKTKANEPIKMTELTPMGTVRDFINKR